MECNYVHLLKYCKELQLQQSQSRASNQSTANTLFLALLKIAFRWEAWTLKYCRLCLLGYFSIGKVLTVL